MSSILHHEHYWEQNPFHYRPCIIRRAHRRPHEKRNTRIKNTGKTTKKNQESQRNRRNDDIQQESQTPIALAHFFLYFIDPIPVIFYAIELGMGFHRLLIGFQPFFSSSFSFFNALFSLLSCSNTSMEIRTSNELKPLQFPTNKIERLFIPVIKGTPIQQQWTPLPT